MPWRNICHLQSNFLDEPWPRVPCDGRDLSMSLDMERQGVMWTAYEALTACVANLGLVARESFLGRDLPTDGACVVSAVAQTQDVPDRV